MLIPLCAFNTFAHTMDLTTHNGFNKNGLLHTIELTDTHNGINTFGFRREKTPLK